MPSAKNKRKPKVIDSKIIARRNFKREIKYAEKKMAKLIGRNEKGLVRWTTDIVKGKETKVELKKLQGYAKGSERHKRVQSHIDRMKGRLKELG